MDKQQPPELPRIRKPPQASLPLTLTVVERSNVNGALMRTVVAVKRPFPLITISLDELANLDKIGEGGEAVVYKSPDGMAWKIFRMPTDEFYNGEDPEQAVSRAATRRRLAQYPKKFDQYPAWIGSRVIAPIRLISIHECPEYSILGYEMPYLADAVPLTKYYNKRWKKQHGIVREHIALLFLDLYDTLHELHACGMLIGDFKPHNILVQNGKAFVIDSESGQFGDFACETFSDGYVDPQLCDPTQDCEVKWKPYSRTSDWYAFTASWFQALTNILPYSGVYKPPPGAPSIAQAIRALKGISVFNQHVVVPEFYESIENAPRELQAFFFYVFERGYRGMPDRKLLESLVPTSTSTFYPLQHTAWAKFQKAAGQTVGSESTDFVPKPLNCQGHLQTVFVYGGKLCFLVWDDGFLLREDGTEVLRGVKPKDFNFFFVGPHATLIGRFGKYGRFDDVLFLINPGRQSRKISSFGFTPTKTPKPNAGLVCDEALWVDKGMLRSSDSDAPLAEFQDPVWLFCGPRFAITITFANDQFSDLFIVRDRTLKRVISLPPLMGGLRRINCFFSDNAVWVFLLLEWDGKLTHYLLVLEHDGTLLGMNAEPEAPGGLNFNCFRRTAFDKPDHSRNRACLATYYQHSLVISACQSNYRIHEKQFEQMQMPAAVTKIIYSSDGLLYVPS